MAYHDGLIYLADTYNNKIKVLNPRNRVCKEFAGSGQSGRDDGAALKATFDEPSGLCYAAGKLYVADTNNHLIRTIDLQHGRQVATLRIPGLTPPSPPKPVVESQPSFDGAKQVMLPETTVKPAAGVIHLAVRFTLPIGYKINPLSPMRYYLTAEGATGPIDRDALAKRPPLEHPAPEFDIKIPVKQLTGRDTLRLSMNYYYCQEAADGVCKFGSVVWTIPVVLSKNAKTATIAVPLDVAE